MAFPQILGTRTKGINGSNTTSHSVTLPTSIAAGELIVVCMAFDGVPTVSPPPETIGANIYDSWSGITERGLVQATPTASMFWKRALGTEGGTTITFTTSASEQSSWVAFRMSVGTIATYESAGEFLEGSSANSTFNTAGSTLTPAKDYTFIAMRSGDSTTQVTAPSTNYTLVDSQAGGTGNAALYVQKRELNTQATTPGSVTVATEQWVTMAIGFYFDAFTIELEQNSPLDADTPQGCTAWSFMSDGLNLKKIITQAFKGTTALSLYAELYAHSGTFRTTGNTGTGVPTGSVLATSQTVTITGTNDYGNIEFLFATPYQTTNATPYFIVIRDGSTNALSSISFYQRRVDTAGDSATFSGGVWSTSSTLSPPPYTLLSAVGISGTITESTSGTESQSVTASFVRTISETAAVSDLTDETLQTSASLSESTSATDSTDANLGAISASLSESISATESQDRSISVTKSITESVSASDLIDETLSTTSSLSESVLISESQNRTNSTAGSVSESSSASDSQSVGINYSVSISESISASESINAIFVLGVSITESVSVTDSQDRIYLASATISESISINDSSNRTATILSTYSESISVTDSQYSSASYVVSVSESSAIIESAAGGLFSSKSITESIAVSDSASSSITGLITTSGFTSTRVICGKTITNLKETEIKTQAKNGITLTTITMNKMKTTTKIGEINTKKI